MTGYNGFSMSNNAVAAYDEGKAPASKIPGVPADLIKKFCARDEWHHTSNRYNCTDFYDVSYVRAKFGLEKSDEYAPNPEAVAALAAHKKMPKPTEKIYENCRVRWLDWGGSRKHPTCTERDESGCRVAVKGKTATITLPNGCIVVKRLETKGFSFKATE